LFDGLKSNGILVLNTVVPPKNRPHENLEIAGFIDATKIALQEIGSPITNTCMMGAFARTTGWLGLDSILSSLKEHFEGPMLEKNIRSTQRGYEEVKVIKY
jgi:pyruvate ferredoxin oxidoreductase gamma subunit